MVGGSIQGNCALYSYKNRTAFYYSPVFSLQGNTGKPYNSYRQIIHISQTYLQKWIIHFLPHGEKKPLVGIAIVDVDEDSFVSKNKINLKSLF
jgi:hypothetical protein